MQSTVLQSMPKRATSIEEYREREAERREIISENRSRRMRAGPKQHPLPVPEKLLPPLAYMVEEPDGTYVGTFPNREEAEEYVADHPDHTISEVEAIR